MPALYGSITIPPAVFHETTAASPNAPGAADVRTATWIRRYAVTNRSLVESLRLELDPGEAEAIACALEGQARLLLIDERRGRQIAQQLGVTVIGLMGVLLLAKRRGLVSRIRPLLDGLRQHAGFWIGDALYARVLQ